MNSQGFFLLSQETNTKSLGIHRTSVEKFSPTIATKNIYNSKKKSLGIHRTSVEKFSLTIATKNIYNSKKKSSY
jgi:hypothetical protein